MTRTTEPELVDAVQLCVDDGRNLNPEARGWSRRPLHTANLAGVWGRNKRWDYWAVQTDDLVLSVTIADIDYIALATVDWIDLASHETGGRTVTVPLARGVDLPDEVFSGSLEYHSKKLTIKIEYRDEATDLCAQWTEADGSRGEFDISVANVTGHESLNVVIPWSDKRFQFTSKHQGLPARGRAVLGDRTIDIGGDAGKAWGILDIGRGRWPYSTHWNWGGGAGHSPDGRHIALQLGAKWTQDTGFTENGVFIDGRLHKIGEELEWQYSWDDPMQPWTVRSSDGSLDVCLIPVHDRHDRTNLGLVANEVHQVFGRWSGTVPDGTDSTLAISDALGFAEEVRARW